MERSSKEDRAGAVSQGRAAQNPMKFSFAVGLVWWIAGSWLTAASQTSSATSAGRGLQAVAPPVGVPQGKRYVVAIGIDHYANWPILSTAVNDAQGFAELLTTRFGYELAVPPLTEDKATKEHIEALIEDDLPSKLKPEDDLVIFFAGHGTTRSVAVGEAKTQTGFLVPAGAHAPGEGERFSDYYRVDDFLRNVSELPARHVLVILDSCHSGLALGSSFNSTRSDLRFARDMARKMSRTVIASASGDELAADLGPVPGHSLFTGLLMQGLQDGSADKFKQGFVTASQLGFYVQHEVGVAEQSRQTPLFGSFYRDEKGELLLSLPHERVEGSVDNLLPFPGDFAAIARRKDTLADPIGAAWVRYQQCVRKGDEADARDQLAKLDELLMKPGDSPWLRSTGAQSLLKRRALLRIANSLPRTRRLSGVAYADAGIRVSSTPSEDGGIGYTFGVPSSVEFGAKGSPANAHSCPQANRDGVIPSATPVNVMPALHVTWGVAVCVGYWGSPTYISFVLIMRSSKAIEVVPVGKMLDANGELRIPIAPRGESEAQSILVYVVSALSPTTFEEVERFVAENEPGPEGYAQGDGTTKGENSDRQLYGQLYGGLGGLVVERPGGVLGRQVSASQLTVEVIDIGRVGVESARP